MSASIIDVKHVSKRYQLGQLDRRYHTFRDAIVFNAQKLKQLARNPFRTAEAGSADSGEFWALRDVSFDINPGDRLGIIGRNGAGKSTLLKILSRITVPTEGSIRIKGRTASLLEVGTGFHPELTGRENVYLNGAILGMSRFEIRRKFDEIVAFAGIERFLDTPVKRYSSGMYVRLAFAVGAHLEPDVLIVDEVLAVGDFEFQKKCLGKMESVSKEGRTVLFVSHNLGAVGNLCNKGLLLENGRVDFFGEAGEAISRYLHLGGAVMTRFDRPDYAPERHAIKAVDILDGTLQPKFSFEYGEELNLRIETSPLLGKEFSLEFRLKNSKQELLGYGSSWITDPRSGVYIPGETIRIRFPKLNLVEDTYFIDLHCRAPKTLLFVDFWPETIHFAVSNAKPAGAPIQLNVRDNWGNIVLADIQMWAQTETT